MRNDREESAAGARACSEPAHAMSSADFKRLSEFIYNHCGIKMPPVKKTMLEARLQKRLRLNNVHGFGEYCDLLFDSPNGGDELVHMIDCVTTNKTDFFREPVHFSYLTERLLPEFMASGNGQARPPYIVWSSACSTGEEPYTLAIVLSEFAQQHPGFRFSIVATDISTRVLDKARSGIYDENQISMIPLEQKQKYFLRSRDKTSGRVRLVPQARSAISFQWLNLIDEQPYPLGMASVDAVFCRNVIIYFDRPTQYTLLTRLCKCLRQGGHLFLGHSESVHGMDLPLVRITSTIYQKV
jgi:chemotaxis protein methyltransferase CheR